MRNECLSIDGVNIEVPQSEPTWDDVLVPSVPAREYRLVQPNSWYKHNFSQRAYDKMLEAQGGGCAICGRKPSRTIVGKQIRTRLALDHNHATGEVRGLLCRTCNVSLGMFGDRPELLEAAAKYLRRSK